MTEKHDEPLRLIQVGCEPKCPWHPDRPGRVFEAADILPGACCPWLYHSIYPYFLALYYGARFDSNEHGDSHVCCPAAKGVNTMIRWRENDGSFDPRIPPEMSFVIFAEIVGLDGLCPHGHAVGERIVFPTCLKTHYMCPAAYNNALPFLDLPVPECIDKSRLRCPDWKDPVFVSQADKQK